MQFENKHIGLNYFSTIILGLFFLVHSYSQDIHFSMPDLAPLNLNPALAGADGTLHATLNSRTQWRAVPAPFNTVYTSASLQFKSQSSWKMIAGFDAYNDKAGEFTTIANAVNFFGGASVKLSDVTTISASIGAGYRQVSIQPQNGQWASQFNGFEYDASILSGESFANYQISGFTSSAGLLFHYSTNMNRRIVQTKKEFFAGAAVYNLNRPEYNFLSGADARLPIRFSFFSKGKFSIKGKKSVIIPAIYYQRQGKFQEFVFGTSIQYNIKNPAIYTHFSRQFNLGWGLYYRFADAIIIRTFADWGDFSVALSYDINHSRLRSDSGYRGGLEIGVLYNLR